MRFAVMSHKGMVREMNEDSYNIIAGNQDIPVTFIIADGMGGHNSGEIASKMAVDFISSYILQFMQELSREECIPEVIREVMVKANTDVYRKSLESEAYSGMGTTLIMAVAFNNKLFIGHVGDSRAYLIRNGQMTKITTDHSYIEELVRNGSLTREEARSHPGKNLITRALGCSEDIQIDFYLSDIMQKDNFLLCTDGLTNMLMENEIKEKIERSDDPVTACDELIRRANENGGEDNITVIVIKND